MADAHNTRASKTQNYSICIHTIYECLPHTKKIQIILAQNLYLTIMYYYILYCCTIDLSWKASEDSSSSSAFVTGVYVRAICNGLRELLKGYVEAIASLELEILNDPYITLNHIRVQLEPFRTLFRVLTGLVSTVSSEFCSIYVCTYLLFHHLSPFAILTWCKINTVRNLIQFCFFVCICR
jgi:hypothetical protein